MNNCRIFYGLSEQQIELAKQQLDGVVKPYQRGEIIIEENAIWKRIGILLNGSVCMSKFTIHGKELLMQKLIPFNLVGAEISCTRKQNAPYTVYSAEAAEIYWFSAEKIMENNEQLHEDIRVIMLRNIMYFIADENMRKYYKIEVITMKGVRERIVNYLAYQQKIFGSSRFYIKLNREELSNFLGVNRSVLSHELKLMEKEGMIKFKKNYFEIIRL